MPDTQRNGASAKDREGVVDPNTELGKDAVDWNNGAINAVNGSVKRDRRSLTSLLAGIDDSASDNNYFVNVGKYTPILAELFSDKLEAILKLKTQRVQ